mgnify:CR=1 FL=1
MITYFSCKIRKFTGYFYYTSMKKLFFYIVLGGIVWFQSCKEVGPTIDFGSSGSDSTYSDDTTYTTTPEVPTARKMLAEEFTGVSCPPCPSGHAAMRAIKAKLNGNLVIIGYHIFNYAQADPVKDPDHKSKYDFRTEDATEVANSLFGGLGGLPEATFDRAEFNSKLLLDRLQWGGASDARAALTSPVNIHITSVFDEATREATVTVQLAYTASVSMKQSLTLAVLEDSIIDVQKNLTGIEDNYVHEHVLRDIVTTVRGTQIPTKVDPKVPGRVYEKTFKVPIKTDWHAEHCEIVAFVTNDDAADRTVVNAEQAKLIK